MINYLLKHPELFQYAIGITFNQFNQLLPKFSKALRQAETKRAYSFIRVRDVGGGRHSTLKDDTDKLFFILFYYKIYPTFRFAQVLFEFDKRNIQLWTKFLSKVLFAALGHELALKQRLHRINSFESWILEYPELSEFIVDCTERAIQRPKDNAKANISHNINQENYYSGKKKHHSVKNQIMVNPKTKRITSVSDTVPGTVHDEKLFESDKNTLYIPPNSVDIADLGYLGSNGINPHLKMILPQKKPKGKELTEEEKRNNHKISSIRVKVEHPISYLKHFNILSQRYRGKITNQEQLNLPIKTVACIYNFTRPPG